MKTYLKIILVALPMMLLSCNKWLDVEPASQVRESELFSTESGFKEALSGVYASLTYEPLYGREMTFGLMGVLAYEWDGQNTNYDDDKFYLYKSTFSIGRIDNIWNKLYNAISNDNQLLEKIEEQRSKFTGDNYAIIKGEALALRAFMHFDLLRVFGASYAENPQKIAIPYYKRSNKEVNPQLTVSQVIDLAIADLNEAAELLKADPIFTGRVVTVANDNGYLLNRKVHLNYYAVKGLLARIYLYKGDHVKALANANEVINVATTKFPWIIQSNIINHENNADLTFSTEHLFGLNITRLSEIYNNSFTNIGTNSAGTFYILPSTKIDYFSEVNDYRSRHLWTFDEFGYQFLAKYNQLPAAQLAWRQKMPMIRLSEMYFIAAEAQKNTNITAAVSMINEVRTHRGLPATSITTANFDTELLKEFKKEFIGEGQLFFFHKRINTALMPRSGGLNLITLKGYKLPIPISEFTNGVGRVDNR